MKNGMNMPFSFINTTIIVVYYKEVYLMKKPNVAFICVHNSCRSQMAEAIATLIASDTFNAYSAGTELSRGINSDAINIIKEIYNYDLSKTQSPKLVQELPNVDIVITMGCNVDCPYVPHKYMEDWGLDDPTNQGEEAFIYTANVIEEKIRELKKKIHLLI